MTAEADAITEDALLGGRLRLRQPRRGHRFGTDAVLLAARAASAPFHRAVELGAGVGAAGLALAMHRAEGEVLLVEISPELAELAAENVRLNGLSARVAVVVADAASLGRVGSPVNAGGADLVLMNPPFHAAGRHRPSPDAARELAHAAPPALLADWIAAACRILESRGRLVLIWRADGLGEVLDRLRPAFGGINVLPVYPRAGEAAARILVDARRGSRAPLAVLPPVVLHDADGRFTPEAEALHRGAAILP
jgi:tRNA1(Val) A37 N6-methylase TrmN6